jgi:ABC-2 type transport system permease protein
VSAIATFRVELSKQMLRVRTYIAIGIVVAIPVLITLAVRYGGRGERGGGDNPFGLFRLAHQSGLVLPAAVLFFMSQLLLPVVVAVFAGDIVAGEASVGNLRYVLVRPVSRARLLAAKLATALLFAVLATVAIVVTGMITGGIFIGWRAVNIDFEPFFSLHATVLQQVKNLGIATSYVAWNMTSVVTAAVMVSTMTDAAAGAIGAGIGLFFVSQILDAVPQLGVLRYGFPTHYLGEWQQLVTRNHANHDLITGVLVQIPYVVVFCAIAFWWFRRKDITS